MVARFRGPLQPVDLDADDKLMTIDQMSEYLQVSVQTLYKWRKTGYGPPAFKLPHTLRYSKRLIDKWLLTVVDDWGTVTPDEVA